MIQERRETNKPTELILRSKVQPMGPAIQERRMTIDESLRDVLFSVYQHSMQEKVLDVYQLVDGVATIE